MKTKNTTTKSGIHQEFVKVLQGASSLYLAGSDRVNNAEHYTRKHANAMQTFSSPELHPDTCQMYRNKAREVLGIVDKDQAGQMACLDGQN